MTELREKQVESNRLMFEMVDGRHIRPPANFHSVRDPEGEEIPECTVYFVPVKRTGMKMDLTRPARRYFGQDKGTMGILPPRIKEGPWKVVGQVAVINYVRHGRRVATGGRGFHHPFKSRQPTLSKSAKGYYKLTLGGTCIVDDRGYVFP